MLTALNAEHERTLQLGFWFQWSELEPSTSAHAGGPHSPQALNRYAYVLGNPLRYTDPTGMQQCKGGDYDGCQGGTKKSGEDLLKEQGQQRAKDASRAQGGGVANNAANAAKNAAGKTASSGPGSQSAGRQPSTTIGKSIQSLRNFLQSGRGSWRKMSAHAEPSTSASKRLQGGTSVEEIYENPDTGERLVRHYIVEKDGTVTHETFRTDPKYGTP